MYVSFVAVKILTAGTCGSLVVNVEKHDSSNMSSDRHSFDRFVHLRGAV